MKKTFMKTAATLAIGMMLGSATFAAAASPGSVQAVFTKLSLVVNGETKTLANQPLVYNGTTYLPVREVANIIDAQLNYDAKNKKIELNTKGDDNVNATAEWISVTDLSKQVDELLYGAVTTTNDRGFTIKNNSVTVVLLEQDVPGYPFTLHTKDGQTVEVKYGENNTTYLSVEGLKKLNLLP